MRTLGLRESDSRHTLFLDRPGSFGLYFSIERKQKNRKAASMSRRDMQRSAWTRVLSKKQIIRDFRCSEGQGKISLLKILRVSEPFVRGCGGRAVVLADAGYFWLQLALDGAHAWYTVMFDDLGRFLQIYVDVTDGNEASTENPSFEDLYLDFVVAEGRVFELDRDELEEAFSSSKLSREQYETALAEGERLRRLLTGHTEELRRFFSEQFVRLLPELDAP